MKWHRYPELEGKHAFLSASQCSWLNYDPKTLVTRYENSKAKEFGTELHERASELIKLKIYLREGGRYPALANFVNDAIDYDMDSEIILFYSKFAFGTADAIKYIEPNSINPRGLLRIHDLKTGVSKPKRDQLLVYCAYFCLEYMVDPMNTDFICRLYQGNNVDEWMPESEDINDIMDTIMEFSGVLENI